MRRLLGALLIVLAVAAAVALVFHYRHHRVSAPPDQTALPLKAILAVNVERTGLAIPADRLPRPTRASRGTQRPVGTFHGAVVARPPMLVGDWAALVRSLPWPVPTIMRLIGCESGGRWWAHNPSGANGLMQILGGPTDPIANIRLGFDRWSHRGLQPWDASRFCWGG